MNHITLSGRLTKDIELRYGGEKNTAIAKSSIAVSRAVAKDKTDFFNITAFGKTAESMEKYLHKGSKIILEGSVQIDEYTNKDGQKRTFTNVVVSGWEFAESKSETEAPKKTDDGFLSIPEGMDEELPFA